MDYLFWKSLQDSEILMFVVSYNIACQWSKYLRECMDKLDHYFQIFDGRISSGQT
jgi:hypothetical protein